MYSPHSRKKTFYPGPSVRSSLAQKTTAKVPQSVSQSRQIYSGHSNRIRKKPAAVFVATNESVFSSNELVAAGEPLGIPSQQSTSRKAGGEVFKEVQGVSKRERGKNQGQGQVAGNTSAVHSNNTSKDVSPYYSSNLNSYVKTQNYYKKFFNKKVPVALSNVHVPGQPSVVNNATELKPLGSQNGMNSSRDNAFFRNRNSVKKQHNTHGHGRDSRVDSAMNQEVQQCAKSNKPGFRSRRESTKQLTNNVQQEFGSMENVSALAAVSWVPIDASPHSRPSATTLQGQFGTFGDTQMQGTQHSRLSQQKILQDQHQISLLNKSSTQHDPAAPYRNYQPAIIQENRNQNSGLSPIKSSTEQLNQRINSTTAQHTQQEFIETSHKQRMSMTQDSHLNASKILAESLTRSLDVDIKVNLPQKESQQASQPVICQNLHQSSMNAVLKTASFNEKSVHMSTKKLNHQKSIKVMMAKPRSSADNRSVPSSLHSIQHKSGKQPDHQQSQMSSLASSRKFKPAKSQGVGVDQKPTPKMTPAQAANQKASIESFQNRSPALNDARATIEVQTRSSIQSRQQMKRGQSGRKQRLKEDYVDQHNNVFSIKYRGGAAAQIIPPVFNIKEKVYTMRKPTKKRNRRSYINRSRDIYKLNPSNVKLMASAELDQHALPQLEPQSQALMNEFLDQSQSQLVVEHRKPSRDTQQKGGANDALQDSSAVAQSKMKEFIQEFRDYQNVRGVSTSALKAQGSVKALQQLGASKIGQQSKKNLRAKVQSPSIPSAMPYIPSTEYQKVTDTARVDSRAQQAQEMVNQQEQDLKRRITSSSRIYTKMNRMRKSFEKRRPDPELFDSSVSFVGGSQKHANVKTKNNMKTHGSEPSENGHLLKADMASFKSLNQLRHLVKVNSGNQLQARQGEFEQQQQNQATTSEDYDPAGSQEQWQMSDDIGPDDLEEGGSPSSAAACKHSSHMVVKNLIITNANLSNCNVFIQNGTETEPQTTQQKDRPSNPLEMSTEWLENNPQQKLKLTSLASENLSSNAYATKKIAKTEGNASNTRKNRVTQEKTEHLIFFEPKESPLQKRNNANNSRQTRGSSRLGHRDPMKIKKSITVSSGAMSGAVSQAKNNIDQPASLYQAAVVSSEAELHEQLSIQLSRTRAANKNTGTGTSTTPAVTNQSINTPKEVAKVGTNRSIKKQQQSSTGSNMFQRNKQLDPQDRDLSGTRGNSTAGRYQNQIVFVGSKAQHNEPSQSQNKNLKSNQNSTLSNRQNSHFRQSQAKQVKQKDSQSNVSYPVNEKKPMMRQTFSHGMGVASAFRQPITKSPSNISLQTQTASSVLQGATRPQENMASGQLIVETAPNKPRRLKLSNFMKNPIKSPLGVGHFGKVWLVKYQPGGPAGQKDSCTKDYQLIQQERAYDDNFGAACSQEDGQVAGRKSSLSTLNSGSQKSTSNESGRVRSILPMTAPLGHYALKMVELHELKKQKQIEHLFNERDILSHLQDQREQALAVSCFPKLYATFKSNLHINFLMEPIDGLTLSEYQKEQVCIKLEDVKFFAAKALVLLDYLHQQRIIYRDLKTENIIIDQSSGEIKFVDLGFAKDLSRSSRQGQHDRTFTKCGTPGYTAPEVLLCEEVSSTFNIRGDISKTGSPLKTSLSRARSNALVSKQATKQSWKAPPSDYGLSGSGGYSYPADVWSWGVLVCELIGGFNPFQGATVQETLQNISRIQVNWPRNLDTTSSQMLQAIFQRDPALRPTLQSLKRSSFFQDVNWNHLESSFEQVRYQTRATVQKILTRKKQSQAPQALSNSNWVAMRDDYTDYSKQAGRSSPHKNYNRRNQPTEVQVKVIHEALADF